MARSMLALSFPLVDSGCASPTVGSACVSVSLLRCAALAASRIPVSLIAQHRVYPAADELGTAAELDELEQECEARDDPTQPLDEAGRRRGRPAGCDHVVDDQHPLAREHGIPMDLEAIGAVLEQVLLLLDLPR